MSSEFPALLLTVASSVLIAYSPTATDKGWPQGRFFRSNMAALFGWAGMIAGLVLAYRAEGLGSVGIGLGAAFILTGAVLGLLRSTSQTVGLLTYLVSVVWCGVSFLG